MSQTDVNMNPLERAIELVDSGIIWPTTMMEACLKYMTFDEIEDMLRLNGFEENLDD